MESTPSWHSQSSDTSNKSVPYVHPKAFQQVLKYRMIKTLGQGSVGKVKLAQHIENGEQVAIKIIPRYPPEWSARPKKKHHELPKHQDPEKPMPPPTPGLSSSDPVPVELDFDPCRDLRILREAFTMKLLDHPNIIKLKDFVITEHHYYMIFEYFPGKQLLDALVQGGRMQEHKVRAVMRQIIGAIDYCHRNSIVHRDLKIENIMIQETGQHRTSSVARNQSRENNPQRRNSDSTLDDPTIQVKILDFGLSNFYKSNKLLSTYCGSLYFAAPELLHAKPYYGPAVDVWSIGVVAYVLLCGNLPFDSHCMATLHSKIKMGRAVYPAFLSSAAVHFLKRMINVDPTNRATIEELKAHPWLNGCSVLPPSNPSRPRVGSNSFFCNLDQTQAFFGNDGKNTVFQKRGEYSQISTYRIVPIPDYMPNKNSFAKLAGRHPNPRIVQLLKRNPFEAADLRYPSSSDTVEYTTPEGFYTGIVNGFGPTYSPPNSTVCFVNSSTGFGTQATKPVKTLHLGDNPSNFGYGGGFGYDPALVDTVMMRFIKTGQCDHPIVNLYFLLFNYMVKNNIPLEDPVEIKTMDYALHSSVMLTPPKSTPPVSIAGRSPIPSQLTLPPLIQDGTSPPTAVRISMEAPGF